MTAAQTQAEPATATDRLIDALKDNGLKQVAADRWMARCPAHDDHNPSLSIKRVPGRVLLRCFAGCPTPDVVSASGLKMDDLFDSPREREYKYDNGRTVIRRYEPSGKKSFTQSNTTNAPELYGLAKVREAVAKGEDTYVLEGEEDCRAFQPYGVTATTAPMGAGNWDKVDYRDLIGSRVHIVADRDKPGMLRAASLRRHLKAIGVEDVIVLIPATGNDAADHVAAGHTLAEMIEVAEADLPVTEVTEVTEPGVSACEDHADLLDDTQAFLERFIAYPTPETATAHTLWVAHTHLVEEFENTPRLAFLSPEPGSGKSRALELTEALVPRPVLSVNASVAYIFRKVSDENGLPTLCMDEVDNIFINGKADGNEDMRGLLNSGYRKGAICGRAAVRGREVVTEEWPTFCAVALAGLNQLPDTLMTRSIVINMKRRGRGQPVEPYRRRVNEPETHALYNRLAGFAAAVRPGITGAWPELPEGIEDRDADCWEPILAVADAAGGHWPLTARNAAVALVAEARNKPATLGIRLLADIREAMEDRDRISTNDLLERLHGMETAPWGNIKGAPIDSRFLARMLSKYQIPTNNTLRIGYGTAKGYLRSHFADAWDRYLGVCYPEGEKREDVETVILNKGGPVLNNQPTLAFPETGNTGNNGNNGICSKHGTPMYEGMCGRCEAGV